MKKMMVHQSNRSIAAILTLAFLIAGGCGKENTSTSTSNSASDSAPEQQKAVVLSGIKASSDMKLADLPVGSYFEVKKALGIYYERASAWSTLGTTTAYFQKGEQVYGLGNSGFLKMSPSLDLTSHTCSLSFDLAQVQAKQQAGVQYHVFAVGTQFAFSEKKIEGSGDRGNVAFTLSPQVGSVISMGCDKMTVKEFEESIFVNKIEVFLPSNP